MSILTIAFGLAFITMPIGVKGSTTYLKEMEATIVYGTTGEGGVEIAGMEIPIGLSGSFGIDPIGVLKNCSWAFSTCDNSKVGYSLFDFFRPGFTHPAFYFSLPDYFHNSFLVQFIK